MTWMWSVPPVVVFTVLILGGAIGIVALIRRTQPIMWIRRIALLVLASLMAATPAIVVGANHIVSDLAIIFVVDGTGSMAAEDYDGNHPRLVGVREDMTRIVEDLPAAHYAIVEFAASASVQLPLTRDRNAVRSWAAVFDREFSSYSRGSNLNLPVDVVAHLLDRGPSTHQYRPVVIVMSDGETQTRATTGASDHTEASATEPDYRLLAGKIEGAFVLGYGTESGGKMKLNETWADAQDYVEFPAGTPAISRIDEGNLRLIASQLGGTYIHRSTPAGISEVTEALSRFSYETQESTSELSAAVIWPIAAIFTVLMAWELVSLMPRLRASGMGRSSGVKRGRHR
ncbi:vWA domain-containing protein [Trueperella sp. LYQ143]|uniref:vWA domain-containing protein n=1 Tax=unclassified Trueperella TaxID=2630174 RepID=UPI0039836FDA